jgi:hypothetical protein
VRIAAAGGNQARNGSASHAASGLHQHLKIVAVGKAPQNLPDLISRQSAQSFSGLILGRR